MNILLIFVAKPLLGAVTGAVFVTVPMAQQKGLEARERVRALEEELRQLERAEDGARAFPGRPQVNPLEENDGDADR